MRILTNESGSLRNLIKTVFRAVLIDYYTRLYFGSFLHKLDGAKRFYIISCWFVSLCIISSQLIS